MKRILLMAALAALIIPAPSFAQTAATSCTPPTFYSFANLTPASVGTQWSLALLSSMDGASIASVSAAGLPPGISLKDQQTSLATGGTLHNWSLSGIPTQTGTYGINVVAQNACGGTSTLITLPVNGAGATSGASCPTGTVGAYPNCVSSTAPTVFFDQPSLMTTSPNPTITGGANTPTVSLSVQGATFGPVQVSGGRFSIPLSGMTPGTHTLYLYSGSLLLITGTLTVSTAQTVTPAAGTGSQGTTATAPQVPETPAQNQTALSCANIAAPLRVGSRGASVVNLQNNLIGKGLLPQDDATGYFGPLTRAAVQNFQTQAGIVSSGDEDSTGFGMVGPRTRAALLSGCGSAVSSGAVSPTGGAMATTTRTGNSVTSTVTLPSQVIQCPALTVPSCSAGTVPVGIGVDQNGCSRGFQCK